MCTFCSQTAGKSDGLWWKGCCCCCCFERVFGVYFLYSTAVYRQGVVQKKWKERAHNNVFHAISWARETDVVGVEIRPPSMRALDRLSCTRDLAPHTHECVFGARTHTRLMMLRSAHHSSLTRVCLFRLRTYSFFVFVFVFCFASWLVPTGYLSHKLVVSFN